MQRYLAPVLGLITFPGIYAASDPGAERIATAQKIVQADPKSAQGYLDLASALCRHARDSENLAEYGEANAALDHALELSPGNLEASKLRIAILLGRHDYADALKRATELNHKIRDDIVVWGYLVDANIAIGDYAEAEKDAQWILDLRRGSTLGFVKAAELREVFGDIEGAVQFYDEALLRTSPNDAEDRAWLMTRNARLQLASANVKRAGELLEKATALNPESQFTREILARLKASQGDYIGAVAVCRQRVEKAENAENLYQLAEMLDKAGFDAEAEADFRKFEVKARMEMSSAFNANRDLVFYYADRRNSPAEALAIATKEAQVRHDSETLDAYAWALYRGGKWAEAKTQMDRALSPGIREGSYFCHAWQIAAAVHDSEAAGRFKKELSAMPGTVCPTSPGPAK